MCYKLILKMYIPSACDFSSSFFWPSADPRLRFRELVIEKMDLSEELRKIILRMVSDGPDDINIIW